MGLFSKKPKEIEEPVDRQLKLPVKHNAPKTDKPWGKYERGVVFGTLGLTVFASVFLALSSRSWKIPGLPRLSSPKSLFEETYVFEGHASSDDVEDLIKEVQKITYRASGVYAFYVVDLVSGETYGSGENEVFQAASLIKLPVMAAMYNEHERGRLNLDGNYALKQEDKIPGAGIAYLEEPGTIYTYRDLVVLMGKHSDNTAFNVSRKLMGDEFIDSYISSIGMRNTSILSNETTPRDIGRFFRRLWEGRIISTEHRNELLDSLTNTDFETLIPSAISDAKVAHKYGREDLVINDAGIVLSDHPYVLVIMSKGIEEREAPEIIGQIASLIHSFETRSSERSMDQR